MQHPTLEILYRDDDLLAINKPHNLLVHRTKLSKYEKIVALQLLRDQIGQTVYPVHRLDRKTSGVLLFALNKETEIELRSLFKERAIKKVYLAIIRGFVEDSLEINYPLTNEAGKTQEAVTFLKKVSQTEIPVQAPGSTHATSRYSLVELQPETGRMHQLRKHCAHINHPIIADRPHGCNKHNKLFKEKWNLTDLMLHAHRIEFFHPKSNELIKITAPLSSSFLSCLQTINLPTTVESHLEQI